MSKRILLCDDSTYFRFINRNILEQGGYEIVGEAEDGREAVYYFEEIEPDLLIMDIDMPYMNGLEALSIIKEEHPDAKIIISSSFSSQDIIDEAYELGAVDYVVKPVKMDELLNAVKAAFKS